MHNRHTKCCIKYSLLDSCTAAEVIECEEQLHNLFRFIAYKQHIRKIQEIISCSVSIFYLVLLIKRSEGKLFLSNWKHSNEQVNSMIMS